MLCCGVFGAVTFLGVSKAIQSSGVYAEAVAKAATSPEVKEALGAPITPGFMMQGSINETNGRGEADFQIPLSGPKGQGTLYVKATKPSGGRWSFQRLEVEAGGARIDLTGGVAPGPSMNDLADDPPIDDALQDTDTAPEPAPE
ncbi:MAG: cytochrome c oxidase assembly factor 1 family protein [Myxococcaceae bacterium]|nr:cytochrome c oxidase assembly factor 1 family protein [Myxococcaceae bacterium]